jgi:hypothetical protein
MLQYNSNSGRFFFGRFAKIQGGFISDSDYTILRQIALTDKHRTPGRTLNSRITEVGTEVIPPPASLQVAQYRDDPAYFMFYLDEAGAVIADGWHLSIEEVLSRAKFEFEIQPDEWEVLEA